MKSKMFLLSVFILSFNMSPSFAQYSGYATAQIFAEVVDPISLAVSNLPREIVFSSEDLVRGYVDITGPHIKFLSRNGFQMELILQINCNDGDKNPLNTVEAIQYTPDTYRFYLKNISPETHRCTISVVAYAE